MKKIIIILFISLFSLNLFSQEYKVIRNDSSVVILSSQQDTTIEQINDKTINTYIKITNTILDTIKMLMNDSISDASIINAYLDPDNNILASIAITEKEANTGFLHIMNKKIDTLVYTFIKYYPETNELKTEQEDQVQEYTYITTGVLIGIISLLLFLSIAIFNEEIECWVISIESRILRKIALITYILVLVITSIISFNMLFNKTLFTIVITVLFLIGTIIMGVIQRIKEEQRQ